MDKIRQELKRMISHLDHLHRKHTVKAKSLFPDHPKARVLWANLNSGRGFCETVEALGLQEEYDSYLSRSTQYLDKKMYESFLAESNSFKEFLCEQLKERFYLLK